jgi:hypothetical protein
MLFYKAPVSACQPSNPGLGQFGQINQITGLIRRVADLLHWLFAPHVVMHRTFIAREAGRQHAQERGLARTRFTDNGEYFSRVEVKTHMATGPVRAIRPHELLANATHR